MHAVIFVGKPEGKRPLGRPTFDFAEGESELALKN
jgi:hypothetical protein